MVTPKLSEKVDASVVNYIGLVADDYNDFGELLGKEQLAQLADRQLILRAKVIEQQMGMMKERLDTVNTVRTMIKTGKK
jgi:hypothetical protein